MHSTFLEGKIKEAIEIVPEYLPFLPKPRWERRFYLEDTNWKDTPSEADYQIFTDGSQILSSTGCGFCVYT